MIDNPASWKGWVATMAVVACLNIFNCGCHAESAPEPTATNTATANGAATASAPAAQNDQTISTVGNQTYPPLTSLSYTCVHMDYTSGFSFSLSRQDDNAAQFSFNCSSADREERWEGTDITVPLKALDEANAILQKHQMRQYLARPLYWSCKNMWKAASSRVFSAHDAPSYSFSARWQGQEDDYNVDGAGPCSQDLLNYFRQLAEKYHGSDVDYATLNAVSLSQNAMNFSECYSFSLSRNKENQATFSFRCFDDANSEELRGEKVAVPLRVLDEANALLQKYRSAEFLAKYKKPQSDPDLVILDETTINFSARWQGQSLGKSADSAGACQEDLLQFFRRLAETYRK